MSTTHPSQARRRAPWPGLLALQRSAGNRAVADLVRSKATKPATALPQGTVQRLFSVQPGDQQYPEKRTRRSVLPDKSTPTDSGFFVSQVEGGDGSRYDDSSGDVEARLRCASNANLLVADGADLAIEDGAEAKVFFATKARIAEANANLGGAVRLRATDRYLVITSGKNEHKLFQVEPYVPKDKARPGKSGGGLDFRAPQRCNEMSDFVSGKKGGVANLGDDQVHLLLADVLDALLGTQRRADLVQAKANLWDKTAVDPGPRYTAMQDGLRDEFRRQEALPGGPARIDQELARLGAGRHMDPSIGDSITTYSVGTNDEVAAADKASTFSYHFGTVVAKSGPDYITLENYARRDARTTDLNSSGDPLFFFRMYGTVGDASTWHQAGLDTGAFAGRAISFVVV